MSDQLTVRSPGDRAIAEYLCDHALIGDCATQLQQTGEETSELHLLVMSIINNEIEVQEGISISALRDMAMTVGDGLGPLAEYFIDLATATWAYADACRVAGDLTKHMAGLLSNLTNALAVLVDEREYSEGWLTSARGLPEDGTANGYLISYTLNEEGALNPEPGATILDGMPKEQAVRAIESHLEEIQTLHEAVHSRNDTMLIDFDSAVEEWEGEAEIFVQALDGILGVLADTAAEDDYQRLGTVGDVAAQVGSAADTAALAMLTVIPFPPGAAAAATVSNLAMALEVAANGGQALKLQFQPGEGSIRVAEGQILGDTGQTGMAASGFIPVSDIVAKAVPLTEAEKLKADIGLTGVRYANDAVYPEAGPRQADLPVDVAIDTSAINRWQYAADSSNPEIEYQDGAAMPSSEARAGAIPEPAPAPAVDPASSTPDHDVRTEAERTPTLEERLNGETTEPAYQPFDAEGKAQPDQEADAEADAVPATSPYGFTETFEAAEEAEAAKPPAPLLPEEPQPTLPQLAPVCDEDGVTSPHEHRSTGGHGGA